jgi:hypothetical protein
MESLFTLLTAFEKDGKISRWLSYIGGRFYG